MRGCDLRQATLSYCDFTRASLVKAKVSGADFLATEFGRKSNRCDMTDVVGTREALFDSRELIHGGKFNDGKDKKFKPTKLRPLSRAKQARLPARPRALLVLGEPGYAMKNCEGEVGEKVCRHGWRRRGSKSRRVSQAQQEEA